MLHYGNILKISNSAIAIKSKNIPAIKILIEKGANISIPNLQNETAVTLAFSDKELYSLLPKKVFF